MAAEALQELNTLDALAAVSGTPSASRQQPPCEASATPQQRPCEGHAKGPQNCQTPVTSAISGPKLPNPP